MKLHNLFVAWYNLVFSATPWTLTCISCSNFFSCWSRMYCALKTRSWYCRFSTFCNSLSSRRSAFLQHTNTAFLPRARITDTKLHTTFLQHDHEQNVIVFVALSCTQATRRFLGDLRRLRDLGSNEPNQCKPNQSTYRRRLPKVCVQQLHSQAEDWFWIFWALLVNFGLGIKSPRAPWSYFFFFFFRAVCGEELKTQTYLFLLSRVGTEFTLHIWATHLKLQVNCGHLLWAQDFRQFWCLCGKLETCCILNGCWQKCDSCSSYCKQSTVLSNHQHLSLDTSTKKGPKIRSEVLNNRPNWSSVFWTEL